MSRKYKQVGYQDSGEKSESSRPQQQSPRFREGPRSPRMPGMRNAVKCALCGASLPRSFDEITYGTTCPNCSADLHTCKNCVYFNPSSRFECTQPVERRVAPKDKRADCEHFQIRTVVEKITTSSKQSPTDARSAFENLFK